MALSLSDLNAHFEDRLHDAGYEVQRLELKAAEHEGRVAENEYFAIAFQPFATWQQLTHAAKPAELEVAQRMQPGSTKIWDTYLLLTCQEDLTASDQFDEWVSIEYDTRHMRKLVRWGADRLTTVDAMIRPFLALERIQEVAQARDPLQALATKLIQRGYNEQEIQRAVMLFKGTGALDTY